MKIGDRVLVVDKNQMGTYLGDIRDSGWLVAEVKLDDGSITKPWLYDIYTINDLRKEQGKLLELQRKNDSLIYKYKKINGDLI